MGDINAEIESLFAIRQRVFRSSNSALRASVTDAPIHKINLKIDSLLYQRDYWAHEQFFHMVGGSTNVASEKLKHLDRELRRVYETRKQIRDEGPVSANETLQSINHALIALLCADRDMRESLS
jgi:hypothetical protein